MIDQHTRPDYTRCTLLTIDMQNDMLRQGSPLRSRGALRAVKTVGPLVEAFRKRGLPVVHLVRLYQPDGSNADLARRSLVVERGPLLKPHTRGARLVGGVGPKGVRLDFDGLLDGRMQDMADNEFALYKPRWGAFHKTTLETFLADRGVNTLIVTGISFAGSVRATIYEASSRDFRLVAVRDCIAGVYDRGLKELGTLGVQVLEAEAFLQVLS